MKQFIYIFLIKIIIQGILIIIALFLVLFIENKNITHNSGVRTLLMINFFIPLLFYGLEVIYYYYYYYYYYIGFKIDIKRKYIYIYIYISWKMFINKKNFFVFIF